MDFDEITSLAWDMVTGKADYGLMDTPAAQSAYCMMIKIYSMYQNKSISKEASIEMRDTIKGIYSDVRAGRYKTL
jgi:hypothetical protein